jgi:NAD(P)-dependent dehydrogenase (short-subunit alcohol dehydrogenase family)
MPDRIRLDGKVAVVTGAAGVIGSATLRLLAERGARIVAVDRREADLKAATSEVASIVAFLASDEASYVSCSAYTVDGGRTAA